MSTRRERNERNKNRKHKRGGTKHPQASVGKPKVIATAAAIGNQINGGIDEEKEADAPEKPPKNRLPPRERWSWPLRRLRRHTSRYCRVWTWPVVNAVLTLAATIAIAFATGFGVYYGERQWNATANQYAAMITANKIGQTSADAAKRAADAAKESNQITSDTARAQLRAYITVVGACVYQCKDAQGEFIPQEYELCLTFKNSGQTPGRNVEINSDHLVTPFPDDGSAGPLDFSRLPPDRHISHWISGPNTEHTHSKYRTIPDSQRIQIETGAKALWFYGRVMYTDIYDVRHTTWFKFISGGNATKSIGELPYAFDGNYEVDGDE